MTLEHAWETVETMSTVSWTFLEFQKTVNIPNNIYI